MASTTLRQIPLDLVEALPAPISPTLPPLPSSTGHASADRHKPDSADDARSNDILNGNYDNSLNEPERSRSLIVTLSLTAKQNTERIDIHANKMRPQSVNEYKELNQKLQRLATTLKHAGDAGLKNNPESWLPYIQHVEAVLLYAYGFWCEDMVNPSGSQWTSLVQLLRFVIEHLERRRERTLAGLCYRLQALTFSNVLQNRSRAMRNRTSKLLGDLGPEKNNLRAICKCVEGLNENVKSNLEDADKVSRYWIRSEGRLTMSCISKEFPRLWSYCTASEIHPSTSDINQNKQLFPRFYWPIHPYMTIPEFVSFGRAMLEEWALAKGMNDYEFASGL